MKNRSESHDDDIALYIKRIVKPIFDKVAKETPNNQLLGGRGGSKDPGFALYSPHNYRLYIDFSRTNFDPDPLTRPTPKTMGLVTHKSINSNSEDHYDNFLGCKIRIKKTVAEIQNCIDHKRTYMIKLSEGAEAQIIDIVKQKDQECLVALREFIKIFGGSSKFKILKRHSENKIYGTDSIDSIPIKEKFHNNIVKKVYNERNVEYSDPVFVVNHLVNSGVIEVVPSICQSIESLAYNINPLGTLKSLIKSPLDALNFKDIILRLSIKERIELEQWLFTLQ